MSGPAWWAYALGLFIALFAAFEIYGPTLRAESVAKLVDAVVSFQEKSVQIIDEMRDLSTANEREIQAAVEDGKQRLVALSRSAATLPAAR